MRKELQQRVLVVSKALERVAGPQEAAEVATKINNIMKSLLSGGISPDNKSEAAHTLTQLVKMFNVMIAKD